MRSAAGAYEIAQYARYEVSGPGAEAWLDHLVAAHIPPVGRIRLAPMLGDAGRLMGDLTVARIDEDRFWLTGSYYLQPWHLRWFHQQRPPTGVEVRNITDDWMGFSVSGPASREIVAKLVREDLANEAFPFLSVRPMDVGSAQAVVGRISLTGELGYEIVVPTSQHRALWAELQEAGAGQGLRAIGDRAVDSLRLEKGYGIWSAEFRQENTPGESGSRPIRRVRQAGFRRARSRAGRTRAWRHTHARPAGGRRRRMPTPPRTTACGRATAWSASSRRARTGTTSVRAWRSPTSTATRWTRI